MLHGSTPAVRLARTGRTSDPDRVPLPRSPHLAALVDRIRERRARLIADQAHLDQAVTIARAGGASWPQIGRALGMTPTAAWKRYVR